MPLPWNRGDEEGRIPTLGDLMLLVGDSTSDRSGGDRRERSEPVLVAPHRDPGEDAENHDMPPEFEKSSGTTAASGEPAPDPAETVDAPTGTDTGAGAPDPAGSDAGSPVAAGPGTATLDAITSDAAAPPADDEASATAGQETDDLEDVSRDSTDRKDTMTVNGQ